MIKKEKILIGTIDEIKNYFFNNLNILNFLSMKERAKLNRNEEKKREKKEFKAWSKNGILVEKEELKIEDQIKFLKLSNNDFGVIMLMKINREFPEEKPYEISSKWVPFYVYLTD